MSPLVSSPNESPVPLDPPILSAELEPTGGHLGPTPDDFLVDEIPLYSPSGSGDHCYVRLRKRGITTPDLVRLVSRAAGVREKDIGVAGLKDKHAVTTQWLSLPKSAVPAQEWQLPEFVQVLETSLHANKLRTGHQAGNRFTLRLVEVPSGGLERATVIAEFLRQRGVRNYFGAQRFGHCGRNLAEALAWLDGLLSEGRTRRRLPRFKEKLLSSVIQSELFNRYLRRREQLGLERPLQGEVVRLDGSASMFVVEAPEQERPRLSKKDIHLTGPLPGPKLRAASAEAAELEAEAALELGLTDEAWRVLGPFAPGARRDLLIWPGDLDIRATGEACLELRFSLPSGGYATQVLREFTHSPWLGSRPLPPPTR